MADWVADVYLLISLSVRSHGHWLVVLLGCLDCGNVRHTGTIYCSEVVVVSDHIAVGEDTRCRIAGKAPGMVLGRVAGIVTRRNIRFAHTADRCNQSAWRGDHGKHLDLVAHIHHTLRGLDRHVHLLYLLVVHHNHSLQDHVAVEVAAAREAHHMAASTSQ